MKMIKWPSIEQFRNVVRNVTQKARYKGRDEAGEPIFDPYVKLPTLKFEGTVKLHGTNAAVGIDENCDIWFQSRENIIAPGSDNAGFALFATANSKVFLDIASNVVIECVFQFTDTFVTYDKDILIFGEWCGGNIQKGIAISQLPKMFVVFGIALVDKEGNKKYLTREQVENSMIGLNTSHAGQIFCIYNFPTFTVDIDFEQPHEVQNILNELTAEVEKRCPVGASMGVDGIGEGIVWRCVTEGWEDSGFWFKVKGEAHSNSKVKTLATVDVERINDINELASKLAHNGRLEQGLQAVFNTLNGGEPDIKRTGEFIKWVMSDIFKEELDTIENSGYTGKDLNGPIGKITRDFLMQNLEF